MVEFSLRVRMQVRWRHFAAVIAAVALVSASTASGEDWREGGLVPPSLPSRGTASYDAPTVADTTTMTALISGGSALLGALIGGSVSVAIEVLRGKGTTAERERQRQLALDDLQRQTLMDLQDAMATWVVTVGELVTMGSPGLPQRELVDRLQVYKLLDRVRDDATRDHCREVLKVGIDAQSEPPEKRPAQLEGFRTDATRFDEALGAVLRRYL